MVADRHHLAANKVALILSLLLGVKSVSKEADSFLVELSEIVVGIWNGDSTRGELSRWFRSALPRWAQEIYLEGLSDGGIDGATASDLDDEDLGIIETWVSGQQSYAPDFIAAVVEAGKGTIDEQNGKQRGIIARMDYWRSSLADLGQRARGKAMDNPLCNWKLGKTEQHCATCLRLANGKPHRLSWFIERGYLAGTAGSETDCGGYNCDCEIVTAKGNKVMYPA